MWSFIRARFPDFSNRNCIVLLSKKICILPPFKFIFVSFSLKDELFIYPLILESEIVRVHEIDDIPLHFFQPEKKQNTRPFDLIQNK